MVDSSFYGVWIILVKLLHTHTHTLRVSEAEICLWSHGRGDLLQVLRPALCLELPLIPIGHTYSKVVRVLFNCSACPRALAAPAWMKFHCRLENQEQRRRP